MLWFERVLVGLLATICELSGLDADRLARHQRRDPPQDSRGRTQVVYRLR